MMFRQLFLAIALLLLPTMGEARLPDIDAPGVRRKLNEMMKEHAVYKEINPLLVQRVLQNYLSLLDPNKVYFLEADIQPWIDPSETLIQQIIEDYRHANYRVFQQINDVMKKAILRRQEWEKAAASEKLPTQVDPNEFKDISWATNQKELIERLLKIRALQKMAVDKLEPDLRDTSFQRIAKRQSRVEDELLTNDPVKRSQLVYTNVLKATAAALDAQTHYFTPDEAAQFIISVQQRLFGIGAQLRDDINGFTITKIVEGGPAAASGLLKVKDKIIAVNGEPVVGMDIADAVELIRGPENTPVTLTVLRQVVDSEKDITGNAESQPTTLDLVLRRGEVVLTEARYESSFEPFGDGVIGYLRLHSFYQDPKHSSASDLTQEIKKLQDEHQVEGIILDLRGNTGGLLTQAVAVTGLFITKGVVASIKDDTGKVQHLRDIDSKLVWDGPLIVLIDRMSASASEIVAQALQDYGRAIVIGDDHSYGKGSFQTFTLNASKYGRVNPTGEYKVTRGTYYTVSGKTPQLVGVQSDVVVPGLFSQMDIGEKFLKYPLENDRIDPSFDDEMLDLPEMQRKALMALYHFDLQPKSYLYTTFLDQLRKNTAIRVSKNTNYQALLEELKKKPHEFEDEVVEKQSKNDHQLLEAFNVMKDLLFLIRTQDAETMTITQEG